MERERADADSSLRKQPFELTSILQDAEPRYAEIDESAAVLFPVRREDLFAYDVVILSDIKVAQRGAGTGGLGQLELQNLYDFVVERGGGLVLIQGPAHSPSEFRGTPLESLLPFSLDDAQAPAATLQLVDEHHFVPTPVGMSFPQMMIAESPQASMSTFNRLGGFFWLRQVDRLKPGALVLAETQQRRPPNGRDGWPLAILQRIGPGRVLTHCLDETYRWRALQGDRYFARYWVQAIRYLSRQKLLGDHRPVELSSNRENYRVGEPVRISARFFDSQWIPNTNVLPVVVENDASEITSLELRQEPGNLDRFVGTVNNLQPGRYRATLVLGPEESSASDDFVIRAPDGEMERLQQQRDELQEAAEISQGKYYSLRDASDLWDQLPPGEPVNVAPLPPRDLWNLAWPIIAFTGCFLTLISLEWILRKRYGLP